MQKGYNIVFILTGERLKAGSEDLAMVVNAGEADKRNMDEDDDND